MLQEDLNDPKHTAQSTAVNIKYVTLYYMDWKY